MHTDQSGLTITSVVLDKKRIQFSGTTSLPDGTCLRTQLHADGDLVAWWPSESCSTVEDGSWQAAVSLAVGDTPATMNPDAEYTVHAWASENPSIEAWFTFDIAGPPPAPEWVSFSSDRFAVAFDRPAHWERVPGYEERYGGADGFLQLSALDGESWTLDEVCAMQAQHKLHPYGGSPTVEPVQAMGQHACLILPSPDQSAAMQGQAALIVPYPRPVQIDGDIYGHLILWADEGHILSIMETLRFHSPAEGATEDAALLWEAQQDDGTCQSLRLTAQGWPSTGPCGEPDSPAPHSDYWQYLGLWPDWLARFAAFEAVTPSGRVVFRGQGAEEASSAWQRALGAWARLVWLELQAGRSGASWGTALAGHWQTSSPSDYCQFLQVESYGYAYASIARCEGGDAYDLGRGWLETSEWLPFDTWLYGRAAVYRQDLEFFGSGSQTMSSDEEGSLGGWARAVYSRLTQGIPVPLDPSDLQTSSFHSPDGQWIAQTLMVGPFLVSEDEQYRRQLKVSRVDDSKQWRVLDETAHYGLGYTLPSVLHWSADGQYLYFTDLPRPDGCTLFINGSDLHRLKLADGSVTTIAAEGARWLSLSPDEQLLAYLRWNGQALELVLSDLVSGQPDRRAEFAARYTQGGHILWSSDGSVLLLTLASSPCDPTDWRQAIVRVDLATLNQNTLVADDSRLLVSKEWDEPGMVRLEDGEGNTWWLDPLTGEVTTAD